MSLNFVRRRLEPIGTNAIYPLHRATRLETCALYWIPVDRTPPSRLEKLWLMAFFDRLHDLLAQKELRQEAFLEMKLAAPLGAVKDMLNQHQMKLIPIIGLGRRPGATMPPIPTEKDLEPITSGKKKFIFDEHVPDFLLWFLSRDERWRRDLFLGYGGYTMLYLKTDPSTSPPPLPDYPGLRSMEVFQQFDVDALWETSFLLNDQLGPKSKATFGKGLEEDPGFEGQSFILPILCVKDFLDAKVEDLNEWFTVFDVYIHESPDDAGILIASREPLDSTIAEVLQFLRDQQIAHPSYPKDEELHETTHA